MNFTADSWLVTALISSLERRRLRCDVEVLVGRGDTIGEVVPPDSSVSMGWIVLPIVARSAGDSLDLSILAVDEVGM